MNILKKKKESESVQNANPPTGTVNVKPCVKCGATNRYPSGGCRSCIRVTGAKYYAGNREKIKERSAKWRAENPEANAKWRAKNPKKAKEAGTRYRAKNPEKVKEATAKWRTENPDKVKAQQAKYRAENPEVISKWRAENPEYNTKYYIENAEKIKARKAKHYTDNPEVIAKWRAENPEYFTKWRAANPDKAKAKDVKHTAKRRCLGYITLNKFFEGSEGHHIGRDYVIFIPKELHRSVYHNFFKGTNMKEINASALDYLFTSATI